MTVRISDNGTPTSRSSPTLANVKINVNRNTNCPMFDQTIPSKYTINQTQTTSSFATIQATDADAAVSYSLLYTDMIFFCFKVEFYFYKS